MASLTTDEQKVLQTTLSQIERQFGKGAIMKLGEAETIQVEGIPTGALSLDIALGGQGMPRGRIVELFGPEASGKSTLAVHVMANAQRTGGVAALIDAEYAFDPTWAKKLGVDLEALLVSQPSCGEEALQIVEMLVKSNAVDVVVVDSVAALVPRAEIEGEVGEQHVGTQARMMSQALRRLTASIARSKTCTIFINQLREKIGVMFGSPETTPGGRALKFYASCRIDVRRLSSIKDGEETVGSRIRAKVVKNKVAPPFRQAEFDLMFDHGISYEGDVLDLGVAHKVVERTGSWFSFGEVRLGQGRENAKTFLRAHPEITQQIATKVLENLRLTHPAHTDPEPAGEQKPEKAERREGKRRAK